MRIFSFLLCFSTLAFGSPRLDCEVVNDPLKRKFSILQFEVAKKLIWVLSFESKETKREKIVLPLRNYTPTIEAEKWTIDYRSPLTGITLKIVTSGKEGTFEATANAELEINDAEYEIPFDERITLINTDSVEIRCETKEEKDPLKLEAPHGQDR